MGEHICQFILYIFEKGKLLFGVNILEQYSVPVNDINFLFLWYDVQVDCLSLIEVPLPHQSTKLIMVSLFCRTFFVGIQFPQMVIDDTIHMVTNKALV